MGTLASQQQLVRFEESTPFTMAVAMVARLPADLINRSDIVFQEGYDELDYVSFSELVLPSEHQVALLYHKRSPIQGIELCVAPDEPSVIPIIDETLTFLNLGPQDILWIHPKFKKEP